MIWKRIYAHFFCRENDLRTSSGKFLRVESCHPESSDFLGLWWWGWWRWQDCPKKAKEEEKKEREFFLRTDRQANGRTILRILGKSGLGHFFEVNWTRHIGSRQIGLWQIGPWQTCPWKFLFREFGAKNNFGSKLGPEKFCAANI